MRRALFVLPFFCVLATILMVVWLHHPVAARPSGRVDIPASPDYLSTGSEQDAIAAINYARQSENLHSLQLPANYWQLSAVQQQFVLVNLERTDRGLHPLQMDANLSQMAAAYSKQMLDLNFFSHTSPIGGTFADRINSNPAIATQYYLAAENLAGNPVAGAGAIYEYMYDDSAEAWGHRNNILDPALTLVGIGLVHGGLYGTISAQEFLAPASFHPYQAGTPDNVAPTISIETPQFTVPKQLSIMALAQDNRGVTRITWFLDRIGNQPFVGPVWTLDLSHVSAGTHTLLAYAVDGAQNYAVAKYTIQV